MSLRVMLIFPFGYSLNVANPITNGFPNKPTRLRSQILKKGIVKEELDIWVNIYIFLR